MVFAKCNECGNEIELNKAFASWIISKNKNFYCPRCINRLYSMLNNPDKYNSCKIKQKDL